MFTYFRIIYTQNKIKRSSTGDILAFDLICMFILDTKIIAQPGNYTNPPNLKAALYKTAFKLMAKKGIGPLFRHQGALFRVTGERQRECELTSLLVKCPSEIEGIANWRTASPRLLLTETLP